jgi:hypothetical protein
VAGWSLGEIGLAMTGETCGVPAAQESSHAAA